MLLLMYLSIIQVFAFSGGPTHEEIAREVYAKPIAAADSKAWDQKTKTSYGRLRVEQMKLADLEGALYNTACATTEYVSYKFQGNLISIERKPVPRVEAYEFKKIDDELNRTYQKALRTFASGKAQEELKKVEKQWLKYRDAWADFGVARFPKSDRTSWLAWITRERIEHMNAHDVNGP